MNRCIRIKRYDRFPVLLDQLRAFPAKYKVKTRENTEKIVHVRSTAMEMTYLFETGQAEHLAKVIVQMENCLSDSSFKLEPIWVLAIRYSLGLYYFGFKGDLNKVLDHLDPTLHDPESALDRRYLTTCRILFLFTHLALGNEQFVYNRLSETIQFSNKHKVHASFIEALIQTLKFLLKPHTHSERVEHFEHLLNLYKRDQLRPDIFSGFRSLTQSILMFYHRDAFLAFLKDA